MKKTWIEKRDTHSKPHLVKTIDKKFADLEPGSTMFIATPEIVIEYVKSIPFGNISNTKQMRKDLAAEYGADNTCPVTTGIFLRIAAEAAFEELEKGASIDAIVPFWRIVEPKSPLAKKLACGVQFISEMREKEA